MIISAKYSRRGFGLGLTLGAAWPIMFVPLRGRAVAARRAHNPEAVGSNPTPATIFKAPIPLNASFRGRKDRGNGRFCYKHEFDPLYEIVDKNTLQLHFRVPIRLLD
jgi:hypothetical protein